MRLVLATVLGVFFSLVFYQYVASQNIEGQSYIVKRFGMEEGLPQSSVNDIIQTRDGYIWLATFGGLVRFDGIAFTTYNRSNTEGMRSDRILHLFEDSKGTIWLATEKGLLKFENGEMTSYLIKNDSFVYSPSMMREDSKGTIWFMAYGTTFKVKGDSVVQADILQDSVLAQKAVRSEHGVWLAHEKEIFRTYQDQVIQIADLSSDLNNIIVDFVELPKHSGEFFIATAGDGVIHYKNEKLVFYNASDGLKSRYTWNFYLDSKQNLWVSSYLGISRWNGSGFTPLELPEVHDNVQLNKVLEDNEGNYWIGSLGSGLFKLTPAKISTIGIEDGLENDKMLSLAALDDGRYVFATNCGGIYTFNPKGQTLRKPPISDMLPNQCVWSVFQDSKHRIWFGSRVLYRSNSLSEPGVNINETHGFDGNEIFSISEDSQGNIWIGALNGLYKYDGETYFRYSTENGLSYNDTRTVFEDRDGVIWVGTSAGLNKIADGNVLKVGLMKKRPEDQTPDKTYISAIHQDEEGVMWFGSYGHGLFRLEDGQVTNITKEHGLFDDIVSHIVEDEKGYFWMGSNRGIFRVHINELNDFADNKATEISGFVYGVNDGMESAETNGGFEPNVIQSEDGKLYFPTVSGVAVVSTQNPGEEREPPPVYIETVKNGKSDLSDKDVISLNYDNAFLQIGYTALSFKNPDKIKFRYKLEGLHENWFEVGNNRSALFAKIPPGEYTFKVTANRNNGPWNNDNASLVVMVAPPFWQTSWFYAIVIILFLSTGSSIYFLRVNKLRRENERQKKFTEKLIESQEQERRRIAMELHDGLGQQILVIKNRAELAQYQTDKTNVTFEQLKQILTSAIVSIKDIRNISHNLRPVHLEKFGLSEAIENLCEQLKETSKIQWSYHIQNIDNWVPQKQEINFYRVIQEAIKNIQKHSSADEASVMVLKTEKEIKATIWDDGKGFEMTDEEVHEGLGLASMTERVKILGGSLNITSKPQQGTTVKILIPRKR